VENQALGQVTSEPLRVHFPDHIQVADCYQCGKCTAGCPVAMHMDVTPNQVVRLAQLGEWDKALRSRAIWECVGCQTCSTRCPKQVDCAGVMDALREASLERRMAAPERLSVVLFQEIFLENIRRNGRLNELELIGRFKMDVLLHTGRIRFLFKDAGLAPQLGKRKKLHFAPGKARDRRVVNRIFERCSSERKR
jgi:heterodisulfide reductase subunit C2